MTSFSVNSKHPYSPGQVRRPWPCLATVQANLLMWHTKVHAGLPTGKCRARKCLIVGSTDDHLRGKLFRVGHIVFLRHPSHVTTDIRSISGSHWESERAFKMRVSHLVSGSPASWKSAYCVVFLWPAVEDSWMPWHLSLHQKRI